MSWIRNSPKLPLITIFETKITKMIVLTTVASVVVVYVYNNIRRKKARKLWSSFGPDVVVLHAPPRPRSIPSISSYTLKVETYLRMTGIQYVHDTEVIYGPKGKFPWITHDRNDVADSHFIIQYLNRTFGKDLSRHLSPELRATARAFRALVEDHLGWCYIMWRAKYDNLESLRRISLLPDTPLYHRFLLYFGKKRMIASAVAQGMGRHTEAEVMGMMAEDLRALSTYLGEKKYLMGDLPCEEDCAVFGRLSQCLWGVEDTPFTKLITEDLVNIKDYLERIRTEFWPDWDHITAK